MNHPPSNYICKICNIPGHWIKQCPKKASSWKAKSAPNNYICKLCNRPGHWVQQCPKFKPKHKPNPSNQNQPSNTTKTQKQIPEQKTQTTISKRRQRKRNKTNRSIYPISDVYNHEIEKHKLKAKEKHPIAYFMNIPVTKLDSYLDELPNVTNRCILYAAGFCKFGNKCPCLEISQSAHNAKVLLKKEKDWVTYSGNSCNYPVLNNNNYNRKWYKSQLFNYLAVLDLEGLPEILEFPVLLIDLNTMKEVGRFHNYVIPEQWIKDKIFEKTDEKEFDTAFYNKDSNAIPFGNVMENFDKWLKTNHVFDNLGNNKKSLLFAICGNWDIAKQIPLQYYRCDIGDKFPKYLYEWMNIKDFGLNFYNNCYANNMKGMKSILRYLKIPLLGTHHSGMDDVSNIAKIVIRYIRDGGILIDTARRNPQNVDLIQFRYQDNKRVGWGGKKL